MTIGYLKGRAIEVTQTLNNRLILVLEVNNIGYELQIPSRLARQLSPLPEEIRQIFIHQQQREEQIIFYGFGSAAERDLFRQLVSVSGIGPQLGLALLDTLGLGELVQAIVTSNIRILAKTPGVGQKTAERLALELKTKLAQWRDLAGVSTPTPAPIAPAPGILEDLEMTLLALGYTKDEIEQALAVLTQDSLLLKNSQVEEWIKRAIALLT
ncbi:MAG: Holliday junction branch migration protein RuvA [Chloroflexaceae bacterium]|nr:Holliday junction branch migration protein RuvA [Chloroflexaceae bacterium]